MILLGLILLLAGCSGFPGGEDDIKNGMAAPALKLKVLYGTSETGSEAVIEAARKYEQLTGISVEINTFTYQNLQGKVISELGQQSGEYDLLALDASWIPRIVQHLEPLSGYIRSSEPEAIALNDFMPNVFLDASVFSAYAPHRKPKLRDTIDLDQLNHEGFEVYSLPIQASALLGSYRKDLFLNKREKEQFKEKYHRELAPPQTLEEYLTIAKFFTRDLDGDGKTDMYGTTLMAGQHESVFVEFQSFLSAFGGSVLDDQLRPAFQLEPGIQALKTYGSWLNTHHVAPPDALSYTWEEASIIFGSGQVAMGLNYHEMELDPRIRTGVIGYFMFPRASDTSQYDQGPQIVSWGLSVNKYSHHKQAAYELTQYLTSPEVQKDALRFKHNVTRKSAYEHSKSLLINSHREYYDVLERSLAKGTVRPRIINYNQVSEAVQSAVQDYLIGKKSAEAALGDAAQQAEKALKKAGY